jgi:putative transposase
MPYEYRKMTPEERRGIVLARTQLGYPYHGVPHLHHTAGVFMISAACFEHAPILWSPGRRSAFEDRILLSLKEEGIELDAWAILTTHYHLLLQTPDYEKLPTFIRRLHNGTSFEWNREDGCRGRKVWFQYFDRLIEDESQYFQAMNYIHYNPAKHGYVEDPYEWQWSSLRLYEEMEGREWLRANWKRYPPDQTSFEDSE